MLKKFLINKVFGWQECDSETYKKAWYQFGGSVCTHPDVIDWLSKKTGRSVSYLSRKKNNDLVSCIYHTNRSFSLYSNDYPFVFEDILLPLHGEHRHLIPFRTKILSPRHAGKAMNSIYRAVGKHKICYAKESWSKTTSRKRDGERKRFIKGGGSIININLLSDEEICDAYIRLFTLRWAGSKRCYKKDALMEVLSHFRHLIFGHALIFNEVIIAIDLIFMSECQNWIYFDDINGGYDPEHRQFSPGTVLLWENLTQAKALCQQQQKEMIFSLGKYEEQWDSKSCGATWCRLAVP